MFGLLGPPIVAFSSAFAIVLLVTADEMDILLAEGFDPAVYEEEIDHACGLTPR